MSRICPKNCSRLISAAIFIAGSIVQLMAGLVLLYSNHIYLLAAPDFWTAGTNFSIGCLVGLSASTWKYESRNKFVHKHGLVGALFVSCLTINSTTCVILILGEGYALMSIQVSRDSNTSDSTLANEILGYAYAASVLSPIVCAAVSAISILVMCCPESTRSSVKNIGRRKFNKKFEMDNSETYNWVYTPEKPTIYESGKRSLLKSVSSSYNSRSSLNLSSSFGNFSSDLTSPVLKTLKQNYSIRPSPIKVTQRVQEQNDTDVSFDENGPVAESEVVPIRLGNRSSQRPPIGIPVRSPIAPNTEYSTWRNEIQEKISPLSDPTQSTRPKTKTNPDNGGADSDEETPTKSTYNSVPDENENRNDLFKDYRMSNGKRLNSKLQNFRKIKLMEAINECPKDHEDGDSYRDLSSPTTLSSGCSSVHNLSINSNDTVQDIPEFKNDKMPSPDQVFKKPTYIERKFMKNRLSGYE